MSDSLLSQAEIDALLCQLSEPEGEPAEPTLNEKTTTPVPELQVFKPVYGNAVKSVHPNLERILDIPLNVRVSLGEIKKKIQDIRALHPGTIVELERIASDPVDILDRKSVV